MILYILGILLLILLVTTAFLNLETFSYLLIGLAMVLTVAVIYFTTLRIRFGPLMFAGIICWLWLIFAASNLYAQHKSCQWVLVVYNLYLLLCIYLIKNSVDNVLFLILLILTVCLVIGFIYYQNIPGLLSVLPIFLIFIFVYSNGLSDTQNYSSNLEK